MKPKRILVVAAHPDDEVLGCGATMAKHSINRDEVHVVILAEGITGRDENCSLRKRNDDLRRLKGSSTKANSILGVKSLNFHDLPDNRMDSVDMLMIVKIIEAHLKHIKPDIVYTHHFGDLNIDHRIVNSAVMVACRPQPENHLREILFFEVSSSTGWQAPDLSQAFTPNWFEDVSSTLSIKLNALQSYKSEMRPWPHARSIKAVEHLARWRGAFVGVEAAEAFYLGRKLIGEK
ncbi:MAG: PIG-L family deacetylase [Nitrospirae bacterium]|nr:PIG-L family deacetylase [Nitrospirota bacterium]